MEKPLLVECLDVKRNLDKVYQTIRDLIERIQIERASGENTQALSDKLASTIEHRDNLIAQLPAWERDRAKKSTAVFEHVRVYVQ